MNLQFPIFRWYLYESCSTLGVFQRWFAEGSQLYPSHTPALASTLEALEDAINFAIASPEPGVCLISKEEVAAVEALNRLPFDWNLHELPEEKLVAYCKSDEFKKFVDACRKLSHLICLGGLPPRC